MIKSMQRSTSSLTNIAGSVEEINFQLIGNRHFEHMTWFSNAAWNKILGQSLPIMRTKCFFSSKKCPFHLFIKGVFWKPPRYARSSLQDFFPKIFPLDSTLISSSLGLPSNLRKAFARATSSHNFSYRTLLTGTVYEHYSSNLQCPGRK